MPDYTAKPNAPMSQNVTHTALKADGIPTTPLALIWDQARRNGGWRLSGIVALALMGALIENLQPYALGALISALTVISGAALPVDAVANAPAHQAFI